MNDGARKSRVIALVRAARKLADPSDDQGQWVREALREQGPLSAEGVELALTHLELHPSDAEIDSLVRHAGNAAHVHVVLSANVFVGALRALALAVAAAPRVSVRMSSRESVFTRALLNTVQDESIVGSTGIVEALRPSTGDEIHLYGHDDTLRRIVGGLPTGVIVRAHGTGMGVVLMGASADVDAVAEEVANDVVVFDQRGCLSPRIVLVEGGNDRALAVAQALAAVLCGRERAVPIGELEPELLGERTRYWETVRVVGELFEAGQGSVGVSAAVLVPPVGRNVHVVPCAAGQAEPALGGMWGFVAAIGLADGGGGLAEEVKRAAPRARYSEVGRMQRPPLDGPVDLRDPNRFL